jgi:starch synthase (maltosyl-transferring)
MEGRARIAIESVSPQIDCGRFPVKRVAGEELVVQADIFGDGHDEVAAVLLFRKQTEDAWQELPMQRLDNDRWQAAFTLAEPGLYLYTVAGWVDQFASWQKDLRKKHQAGQDLTVELEIGRALLEASALAAPGSCAAGLRKAAAALATTADRDKAVAIGSGPELLSLYHAAGVRGIATRFPRELCVSVDRKKALFSSWYELFPRSCGPAGKHGTFKDCLRLLPEISEMGFDVLYLPPIHPIGRSGRKGRGNASLAARHEPGSPWAIGSQDGGHKAVHPELGSLEDFRALVAEAGKLGVEIALDLAFQCSPDHPYLTEHPEWFLWRPDGSVQYAENPPKKYQDIVPFNFETEAWRELWEELRSVVFFWMDQGVLIFRADNPHTKPFPFWQWLIGEAKQKSPEVIFLAEAFTRPKVMHWLAKLGFNQSYSYFAWRSSKEELISYLEELTGGEAREYLRPNFWPNTPDILTQFLQVGGRPAFMIRLVLAGTLSSSYGIYGPPFELCVGSAEPESEEYRNSEKYEIRSWDREAPGSLRPYLAKLNRVRRENPALQSTNNLKFYPAESDSVLFYGKSCAESGNTVLVVVNLDPFHPQKTRIQVPTKELGIEPGKSYLVQDLLSGENFIWQGDWNSVELDPATAPARIFRISTWKRREADFDYYL